MPTRSFAILFTDLVDSTKMKSLLPGDSLAERNRSYAAEILLPHRKRVETLLAEHDGTVVELIGDSFFAVFPDIVDAARFAAHVQRSHATQPIATPQGPLMLRIGIHFGAPEDDPARPGHYIGQEVDYASRLMSLAGGGQVVLSESAATLLRQSLSSGERPFPHGDRELKGIGRVPVFELLYDDRLPHELSQASLATTNLPPRPERVVGREAMLDDLCRRVRLGGCVLLKGEGGMGKTTLAVEAAHRMWSAGELANGCAYIGCETKPALAEVWRQAAEVFFGNRLEEETVERCAARIERHLATTSSLLVLDNFETVAGDEAFLRWIAELRAPQRLLITTREAPFGLRGEVVSVAELTRDVAAALFREICAAAGRRIGDDEEPSVREICAAIGDHPLAIELLATRAARMPLAVLHRRVLEDAARAAAVSDVSLPVRHRSLTAGFELSFEALSPSAQRLLVETSPVPGGIGAEMLDLLPLDGDSLDDAEALVNASLWRVVEDRYVVHPIIRQSAAKKIPDGDLKSVRLRLAGAFVDLAVMLDERRRGAKTDTAAIRRVLDLQESELPNFLMAADVACEAGEHEMLDRLLDALEYSWRIRGQWDAAERLTRAALEMPRSESDVYRRARLQQGLGRAYRHLARFQDAEKAYVAAVQAYEQTPNRADLGEALSELSRVHTWMNRIDEALDVARRGVALLQETGDEPRLATALSRLGVALRLKGDMAGAMRAHEESLNLCRRLHDRRGEGRSLGYLSDCYRHDGRSAEADRLLEQCLVAAQELNDRRAEADTYLRMGKSFIAQERWTDAEHRLMESLAVYRECAGNMLQARVWYFYAVTLERRRLHVEALRAVTEARNLYEGEVTWFGPMIERLYADLTMEVNDPARAPQIEPQTARDCDAWTENDGR